MSQEVKKIAKMIDEVTTYCLYHFDAPRTEISIEKTADAYTVLFHFHGGTVSPRDLAQLKEKLAVRRNPELEDYYWQLTGEIENGNELALVAMMSDTSDVAMHGDTLSIALTRKH